MLHEQIGRIAIRDAVQHAAEPAPAVDPFFLVGAALFTLLAVLIYCSLADTALKENPARSVISVAAAGLCVIALVEQNVIAVIPLPYAALAISLPFVMLLALLSRVCGGSRALQRNRTERRSVHRETKRHSRCLREPVDTARSAGHDRSSHL